MLGTPDDLIDDLRKRVATLEAILYDGAQAFGAKIDFTPSEARVFAALLNAGKLTNDQLYDLLETRSPRRNHVAVVMHRIRSKLRPYDIEVRTLWNVGYAIDADAARLKLEAIVAR